MDFSFKNNKFNLGINTQQPNPFYTLYLMLKTFQGMGENTNTSKVFNYFTVYLLKPHRFNLFSFYIKDYYKYLIIGLENNPTEESIKIVNESNTELFFVMDLFFNIHKKQLNSKSYNLLKIVFYHNLTEDNIYVKKLKTLMLNTINDMNYITEELHKYIFHHFNEWSPKSSWQNSYDLYEENFYELIELFSKGNKENHKSIAKNILLQGFYPSKLIDEKRLSIIYYLISVSMLDWNEMSENWKNYFKENDNDFLIYWDKLVLKSKLENNLLIKGKIKFNKI